MLEIGDDWFRVVFEKIPAYMVIIDSENGLVRVNPALCAFLGYSEDEMPQVALLDFIHPEDQAEVSRQFGETRTGLRSAVDLEARCNRKDGSVAWVRAAAALLRNAASNPVFLGVLQDITERKIAEEALRDSNARLTGIIDSSFDAIITTDDTQHIVLFNAAAETLFSCSASDALGQPLDRFIPERFRNLNRQHILVFAEGDLTVRKTGEPGKLFALRADGREVPIEAAISQFEVAGGKLSTVTVRDLTERRQAEAKIAQLAAIVESSQDAIIGQARDGTVLSWNRGAEILYGYSAEEVLGQNISPLIPPDRLSQMPEILAKLDSGERVDHFETVRVRKDGGRIDVSLTVSPVRDAGGVVRGVSAIARDITERKAMEQELLLRERRLNSFFTTAPAGLAILDADLRFLQINDTLAGIRGLQAQQPLGRTIREALPAIAPVIQPIILSVLESGKAVLNLEVSSETLAHPGLVRQWVASYFPITGGDEKPKNVGVIMVEITEQKQAEKRVESSLQQLRGLAARLQSVREEERTRIAAEVHDELGAALTGLKIDLSWLIRGLSGGIGPLQERAASMSLLIDRTIDSVRRIATQLRPGVLDHLGLLAAIEWQAQEFETRTGVRVTVTPSPVEGTSLDRDRSTAIFRIFQEILTNVARHANATGVTVSLKEEGNQLVLYAEDNGRGITESEIQSPKALGLLGMRERALLLGGGVTLTGTPGKGTRVTVRIPLRKH